MKKIAIVAFAIVIALIVFGNLHEHNWKDATCDSPKTCVDCGATEGDELDHLWLDGNCETPRKCFHCGETTGIATGHIYLGGDAETPATCLSCGEMKPLELPESGQVFIGKDLYTASEITIKSSSDKACYVKLKDSSGKDVFSFFVRAGDDVTVPVPGGYYNVYFAYGTDWYGTEHLFGDYKSYSKDDELVDFENYTWTYTLYPTDTGNFTETIIDEEEFK